jgi:predicted ATPase
MDLKISIENFKSVVTADLELRSGINILIGQNGAGKTCVLYSLKFIRDILLRGVGLAMARGGGPSRVYHRSKKKINFRIEFDYGERVVRSRKRKTNCYWVFSIEQKGSEKIATITYERILINCSIEGKTETLYKVELDRRNLEKPTTSFEINDKLVGKDILNAFYDQTSSSKEKLLSNIKKGTDEILTRLKKDGDRSVLSFLFVQDRSFLGFYSFFSSLNEYNIIPERARQASEQLPFSKMEPNGFGISEVIDALIKKNFHKISTGNEFLDFDFPSPYHYNKFFWRNNYYTSAKDRKSLEQALEKINKEISSAVKPISNVNVKIDNSTGRRFVVFEANKYTFYPDEVSDGTIKWLCILTSIFVGFSNIYLLEEPENFLHPWMQQKLIQIMREQAQESETIFLLTSHSITMLNSCFPKEVRIVESTRDGTKIKAIEDQDEITEFLKDSDFRLGDLWVSGGIGAIPE